MIIFSVLVITLLILMVIGILAIASGAAAFFMVFGDILVFGIIIYAIVKWLLNRKK